MFCQVFLRFLPLCLFAKLRAASTLPNPHFLRAKAFLVGSPLGFFIGPFMPAKRAANETRLGLVPFLTGGFKLAPSFLLKYFQLFTATSCPSAGDHASNTAILSLLRTRCATADN